MIHMDSHDLMVACSSALFGVDFLGLPDIDHFGGCFIFIAVQLGFTIIIWR